MKLGYIKQTRDTEEGEIRFVARDDVITVIHNVAKASRAKDSGPHPEDNKRAGASGHAGKVRLSRWTIDVPGMVPPSLNEVLRMHWSKRSTLRKGWSECFYGLPRKGYWELQRAAIARKKVRMLITLHNARQYDRDNVFGACKVIVDMAKLHNLFHDDRPEFLDLEVKQERSTRKAKHTTIELEVLGARGKR